MKTSKIVKSMVAVVAMLTTAVSLQAGEFKLKEASLADRVTYHRAMDAAVWAMPLMSFKFYRDALADAEVGPGDVGSIWN